MNPWEMLWGATEQAPQQNPWEMSWGDDQPKLTEANLQREGERRLETGEAVNQPMAWSDVALQAKRNLGSSAVQFGSDIAQPFLHPIDTATNVAKAVAGGVQKAGQAAGLPGIDTTYVPVAEAIGEHFANRYGGVEEFKRSLASDPVGVAGDISVPLTGGGGALARAPGIAGRVGEIAAMAGRAVDPLNIAAKAVTVPVKAAGTLATAGTGVTSGVGREAIQTAASAGREGGAAAEAFQRAKRGEIPIDEVVSDARGALEQMRQDRGATYRQDARALARDKTILSWNDVDIALQDMDKVARYKGQNLSPSTANVRNEINAVVADWKNLRASEFWTPEGFDALKKRVSDIRDTTQPHTPDRVVANQMYKAIGDTVRKQAPIYDRMMADYRSASQQIGEIEKTFSLGEKASPDTTIRKLQSVMRNNVQTNYGRRGQLADVLAEHGAPHLREKLAGQALSTWEPRGLARVAAPIIGSGGLAAGAALASPLAALGAGAGLAASSPRVVGNAAYYGGALTRPATALQRLGERIPAKRATLEALRQTGRIPQTGIQ